MKILGFNYDLVLREDKEDFGKMDIMNGTMFIDTQAPLQIQLSTVLHEALHALDTHLCLRLGHSRVRLLEAGLFAFLSDNGVDLSPLLKGGKRG